MSYEAIVKVRLGDIDHAGVVFYPRIAGYFHVATEEFFAERAGLPYHELLDVRRLGLPTVRLEVDYREPLRFGDILRVEVAFAAVGNTSVTARYRVRRRPDGPVCAEGRVVMVCVTMDGFRPVRLPDDLRAVFGRHPAD